MWDKIPADWAAAFVTGLVTYIGHKLWSRASDKQKQIVNAALDEARAIISTLVLTAKPGTTVEQIEIYAKGAIAIQLAKRGIDPKNPLVSALTAKLVAEAIEQFVHLHPDKPSVVMPMAKKLTAAGGSLGDHV